MKKIAPKRYVDVGIFCILGFLVVLFASKFKDDKVSATENTTSPLILNEEAEETDYLDIFDEALYDAVYNESDRTVYVSFKGDDSERLFSDEERYSEDDAEQLASIMLGDEYELRLISKDEGSCMYEEYKDGHQTGGLATYLFDREGYISEASFRKGTVYEFDEDEMISEELAFELAVKAIKEKYGEDTVVEGTVDDYMIKTYYVPKRDEICYWIDKITGHVQEYVGTVADPVYFYVTVSPDGTFVEVASTLRY